MNRFLTIPLAMIFVFLFSLVSRHFRGTPLPDATELLVASFIVAWMAEKPGGNK